MPKFLLVLLVLFFALCYSVIAADAPAAKNTPDLPKRKINPKDGAEMVLIPAGEFLMGTSEAELTAWLLAYPGYVHELFKSELPQHKVYLDAFYLYKTEVTVAQYRKFCKATKREMPFEPDWKWQDTNPIVNVTWNDAKAYADWAGASLPTEAQWEKAARGGDRRVYAWGNDWPPSKGAGNFADETYIKSGKHPNEGFIKDYDDGYVNIAPVGSFTANPFGLYDMVGNVWEWCSDWYDEGYYKNSPAKNPTGPKKGDRRVMRGGTWYNSDPQSLRAVYRIGILPILLDPGIGFRCALCLPEP